MPVTQSNCVVQQTQGAMGHTARAPPEARRCHQLRRPRQLSAWLGVIPRAWLEKKAARDPAQVRKVVIDELCQFGPRRRPFIPRTDLGISVREAIAQHPGNTGGRCRHKRYSTGNVRSAIQEALPSPRFDINRRTAQQARRFEPRIGYMVSPPPGRRLPGYPAGHAQQAVVSGERNFEIRAVPKSTGKWR